MSRNDHDNNNGRPQQQHQSFPGSSSPSDDSNLSSEEDDDDNDSNEEDDVDENSTRNSSGLTLLESRALKVERNNAFLVSLGLLKKKNKKKTTNQTTTTTTTTNEESSRDLRWTTTTNRRNDDEKDERTDHTKCTLSSTSKWLSYHPRCGGGILLPQLPPEYDTSTRNTATAPPPTTSPLSVSPMTKEATVSGAVPSDATTSAVAVASPTTTTTTTSTAYFHHMQQILIKYPGRTQQVNQLASLLWQSPGTGGIPIFVTGPAGTGKTSVVQTVGTAAVALAATATTARKAAESTSNCNHHPRRSEVVVYSYVNMATASRDYSWIRQIQQTVLNQLQQQQQKPIGDKGNNTSHDDSGVDQPSRRQRGQPPYSELSSPTLSTNPPPQGELVGNNHQGVTTTTTRHSMRRRSATTLITNNKSNGNRNDYNDNNNRRRKQNTTLASNSNSSTNNTAQDMMVTVPQQQQQQQTISHDPATFTAVLPSTSTRQSMAMHALGLFLHQHLCGGVPSSLSPSKGAADNDSNYYYSHSQHDQHRRHRRMILVLDQAERLFDHTSSNKQSSTHHHSTTMPNILGQLLLLPQTMNLMHHLTIVIISNSLFLDHTRMNMMVEPTQSLATLMECVQPIQIYFPTYQDMSIVQSIFQTPRVSLLVTGESTLIQQQHNDTTTTTLLNDEADEEQGWGGAEETLNTPPISCNNFSFIAYQGFVRTFFATMYDLCKDMNELIRMGRILWPIYIQPLSSTTSALEKIFQSCLAAGRKKRKSIDTSRTTAPELSLSSSIRLGTWDSAVLVYLDGKALPKFRLAIETCFGTIQPCPEFLLRSNDGSSNNSNNHSRKQQQHHSGGSATLQYMSRPARYLLLAAYLCQVNRPEQDRSLFSIERNGRPSRKRNNASGGDDSVGPLETTTTTKSLRLRNFPLERMMSIYVSLMTLHDEVGTTITRNHNHRNDSSDRLIAAASSLQERFGEVLYHLQSLRVIQVTSSSGRDGDIRLSEPRYTCPITPEQAQSVATSLDFPLDRYVL